MLVNRWLKMSVLLHIQKNIRYEVIIDLHRSSSYIDILFRLRTVTFFFSFTLVHLFVFSSCSSFIESCSYVYGRTGLRIWKINTHCFSSGNIILSHWNRFTRLFDQLSPASHIIFSVSVAVIRLIPSLNVVG